MLHNNMWALLCGYYNAKCNTACTIKSMLQLCNRQAIFYSILAGGPVALFKPIVYWFKKKAKRTAMQIKIYGNA